MSTPADLEQDQLILDSVGRFLDREVKPHVHALEHDDIWPEDIVEGMKALGLFGATIGADHGGLGLSASTYARIASDRRRAGRPLSHFDAQIAAIARFTRAAIATRNTADFDGCGVTVVDPWKPR